MSLLNYLRQKSDKQKRLFSFVFALVLTGSIFIVWVSFSPRSTDVVAVEENKLSSRSPLGVLKEEFSKAFSGFQTELEAVTEVNDTSTTTATTTATTTDDTWETETDLNTSTSTVSTSTDNNI